MAEVIGLRDRKKLETWRAIRAAAIELFLARGFEAVSVQDIAEAANVSPSTFFNYFTTKEAAVFDPDPADAAAIRDLLLTRPPAEPLWTSLREVLLGYLAGLGDRVAILKRLRAASSALDASGRTLADRTEQRLRAWAATRDQPDSELEATLLIKLALAAVHTAYEAWQLEQGLSRFLELARDCLDRTGADLTRPAHGLAQPTPTPGPTNTARGVKRRVQA